MKNAKKYPVSFILILLIAFVIQPVFANEQADIDKSSLHEARDHLSTAFKKYNNGDIPAAKQSLKQASELLSKATEHSKSDKVKSEAEKLSKEIDNFRSTLNKSSEQHQNTLVRFWHRVTSLIKRESDHIIHSYTKSQNDNVTLKYILNAKMNFYVADHDLFVSHDTKDVTQELSDSITNLVKADEIARADIKIIIQKLISNIKTLIKLTETNKESWKKDDLVHSLDKAIGNLVNAKVNATPATVLRLNLLGKNINQLKFDIQKINLKTRYDSIMVGFNQVIKNI